MKHFIQRIAWAAFVFGIWMHPLSADVPQVTTQSGRLEGVEEASGILSFKGIPYAQPPVGDLRWREPAPVQPWSGVRAAKDFGPRPMQPTLYKDMIFRSKQMSEDCLYLNIWTPKIDRDAKLPVLFYIHGGGLITGDGSEPRYDGESDAQKGVVVVTINYRLGVFGFLALHDLSRESVRHVSGNYGLLDQRAALLWVRSNIAAFGGDPAHITIAGQSAGAMSVAAHMVSPLSRNLFVGAIGESGSVVGDFKMLSLKEAEERGHAFAESHQKKSLAELRAMSSENLLAATDGVSFDSFPLVLDHYFFAELPTHSFATGRQMDVPLLIGWNSAEIGAGSILGNAEPTPANYRDAVGKKFGADANAILKQYPGSTNTEVEQSAAELASDYLIVYNTWKCADLHSKTSGSPVFRYFYQHALPGDPGARHSSEIAFAMGNLRLLHAYEWTKDDFQTSETMQSFFVNFIKTGNPNGANLPHWPWIQASIPKVMSIDSKTETIPEPNSRRFLFWDSIYYN
jgi:para-nitrobenzyl esterase